MTNNDMTRPITVLEKKNFIPVDKWIPEEQDKIFKHVKGAIILPLCEFCGSTDPNFNDFILSVKRCYNSDEVRNHCCQYMNYFEKFYDTDHELFMIYYRIKYLIDYEPSYTQDAFVYDIYRYILTSSLQYKAKIMTFENYSLDLDYKNKKNPGLQYSNKHGQLLMLVSVQMNMIIPLLTHFMYKKKIKRIKYFLLSVYDMIFKLYNDEVDLYNKLYETSITNINKSRDNHSVLWNMQSIRARNTTTHAIDTVNNIILQIMPKYSFDKNIIPFNYNSVLSNIKYKITAIQYESNHSIYFI